MSPMSILLVEKTFIQEGAFQGTFVLGGVSIKESLFNRSFNSLLES